MLTRRWEGRRPGGAKRRRHGRSPCARRNGGRPAARSPAPCIIRGRAVNNSIDLPKEVALPLCEKDGQI